MSTVRVATPLLLAALGEMLAERGGSINLGIEGAMLAGALAAALGAAHGGVELVARGVQHREVRVLLLDLAELVLGAAGLLLRGAQQIEEARRLRLVAREIVAERRDLLAELVLLGARALGGRAEVDVLAQELLEVAACVGADLGDVPVLRLVVRHGQSPRRLRIFASSSLELTGLVT